MEYYRSVVNKGYVLSPPKYLTIVVVHCGCLRVPVDPHFARPPKSFLVIVSRVHRTVSLDSAPLAQNPMVSMVYIDPFDASIDIRDAFCSRNSVDGIPATRMIRDS